VTAFYGNKLTKLQAVKRGSFSALFTNFYEKEHVDKNPKSHTTSVCQTGPVVNLLDGRCSALIQIFY